MAGRLTKTFEELDDKQLMGLLALNSLAVRESTSLSYQWKEWGLNDIPLSVVVECEKGDIEPVDLIKILGTYVLETLSTRQAVKSLSSISPDLSELLEDFNMTPASR